MSFISRQSFNFVTPITEEEKLQWLQLIRSENVGPVTFYDLLQYYGSAKEALTFLPKLSKRGGLNKSLYICKEEDAYNEWIALKKMGGFLIARGDPNYPKSIAILPDAPPLLSVLGNPALLTKNAIGIVGARNASINGQRLAEKFAENLGKHGYGIASGLARGIDTAAHKGALSTGTVAVVAGGIDIIYPPENESLYKDIIAHKGAVVAEMPLGTTPQATHFPRRNRLISGLSQGLLVVEAALHSGSLITARYALEQGREVFAIPGSPLDPRAQGTNNLIKQGATLVQTPEEVIEALRPLSTFEVQENMDLDDKGSFILSSAEEEETHLYREKVFSSLSHEPTPVDEIIRRCQIKPPVLMMILIELELAGRIQRHPGNQVSLVLSL